MQCSFIRPIYVIVIVVINLVDGNVQTKRLYNHVVENAEATKFWRPVLDSRNTIIVYAGVTFIQIMNVEEKSRTISISLWIRLIWKNRNLSWNPDNFGGIKSIYLPPDSMWVPDIVLFNNADGKYSTQFPNTPTLYHNGIIDWKSPAMFLSKCEFDMRYFPYDEQTCYFDFGSWTYSRSQLKIKHIIQLELLIAKSKFPKKSDEYLQLVKQLQKTHYKNGAFFDKYQQNGEWDLLSTPTILPFSNVTNASSNNNNNETGQEHKKKTECIKFGVKIRRKIMFYNINLIFPMVVMSILAAFSFYLPPDSEEKITLSTLIVLSITVFFVLLSEQVPATSIVTPIINQYLIISFLLISASLLLTVIVLNFNSRSSLTDQNISPTLKKLLQVLPQFILIQPLENSEEIPCLGEIKNASNNEDDENGGTLQKLTTDYQTNPKDEPRNLNSFKNSIKEQIKEISKIAIEISNQLIEESKSNSVQDEWKYVAYILDRLMLLIFGSMCILVGLVTYLQSPTLRDTTLPLNTSLYNDSKFNELFSEIT